MKRITSSIVILDVATGRLFFGMGKRQTDPSLRSG